METITKKSETEIAITTTEVKEEVYSKDTIITKIAECDALLNEVSSKKDTWVALLKEAVKLEVKTTDELAEVVV